MQVLNAFLDGSPSHVLGFGLCIRITVLQFIIIIVIVIVSVIVIITIMIILIIVIVIIIVIIIVAVIVIKTNPVTHWNRLVFLLYGSGSWPPSSCSRVTWTARVRTLEKALRS